MLKINGQEVKATEFFFDGCHKIYVADTDEGYKQMYDAGWDDDDVFPIEDLPYIWIATCPLRFINSADLGRSYVRQCEPARFDGWELEEWAIEELDLMAREQMEANGEE